MEKKPQVDDKKINYVNKLVQDEKNPSDFHTHTHTHIYIYIYGKVINKALRRLLLNVQAFDSVSFNFYVLNCFQVFIIQNLI